jgi:hypothetical protein
MASGRYYDYTVHDEAPRRSRHHRSHRRKDDDYDSDEEAYIAARRERRERRQAEQVRRDAEQLDIDELRARRQSFYTQPEPDRRRESQRMAQSLRPEREIRTRSPRGARHDGARRKKKSREVVHDDRSDDYVYGRPRSRGFIEEVTIKRSSAPRRSDEGGSSSRTPQSPLSGSRSASSPMADVPKVSRSVGNLSRSRRLDGRVCKARLAALPLPSGWTNQGLITDKQQKQIYPRACESLYGHQAFDPPE